MNKHDDILHQMIDSLERRKWQPGKRVPPIRKLSQTLDCSVATLAAVFRELTARGYIVSKGKLGTFVTAPENWGKSPEKHASRLVGVMLTDTPAMMESIESTLQNAGYSMVLSQTHVTLDAALNCIELWRRMGLHGVIWSPISTPNHVSDNLRLARAIQASGMQSVAVDRYPPIEVNCVVSDNIRGGQDLTRHFIEQGHRRIGLIRHRYGSTPEDRMRGYLDALQEAGIDFDPSLVLTVDHGVTSEVLIETIQRWLQKTKPTAVWSIAGEPLGQAMMAAVARCKLRVPQDLALATFDEVISSIPVTSMIQPFAAIGRRAAELLISLIQHPTQEIARIVLPSRMVVAESSRIQITTTHNIKKSQSI